MAVICTCTFIVTFHTTAVTLGGATGILHTEVGKITSLCHILSFAVHRNSSKPGGIRKLILTILKLVHI